MNRFSFKSGLAALAFGALTLGAASLGGATTADAKPWGHGHGHGWGGHGHWGGHGGHWGGHRHWGYGPRYGVYLAPRYVRDCYRVWRRIYIPGEGYVRTRARVCD